MTAIMDRLTGSKSNETFDSLNPATGDVVGTHPVHSAEHVDAAVDRAREASEWWQSLGFDGRRPYLQQWKGVITRRMAQLADVVHRETGKPHGDAQLEIVLAIDHLDWASKHAKKVLGRRRVSSGIMMANNTAYLAYNPLGVIGVIGPWNFPVYTPLGSISYALSAGNAVVFKPSEYTPGVGRWLADSFTEVVHGRDVFQVVTGFGETGEALCKADIDKLAFTGSGRTGKKVMAACSTNLTPVIIEGGGKDATIIDEDVDVEKAAELTLWGGMFNSGQACVGTERVYVHEKVFTPFVEALAAKAREVRAGFDDGSEIGPITMPGQIQVIRDHLEDAVAKGADIVLGGPDAVGERYVQPTILTNVPEDSTEMTEETFGPTLAINPVASMDEAVERTNASRYGLAGTVFSKRNGLAIAERIRSGMTSINAVIAYAGVPSLPFGGVGQSGFGRIHGPDGLKEFTYSKAITKQRFKPPLALTTFARDAKTDQRAAKLIGIMHGGKRTLPKR